MVNATTFDPKRQGSAETLTPFSYGKHSCFGRTKAQAYLNGIVKLVAGLKNLRPAAGEMGVLKTIQVGGNKLYLNDSWSYLAHDASSKSQSPKPCWASELTGMKIAWKLHFDGHGKGNYAGDLAPTDTLDLGTYYGDIKKQKDSLVSS